MGNAWNWVTDNGVLLGALGALSVLSLIATLVLLPLLVVRIPPEYFRHRHRVRDYAHAGNPLVHHTLVVLKNVLGVALILAGIGMLVLPGQGLLTLLIGLMLTDFPGKYGLEKQLVRQPGVLKAINWLRTRAGHPPILAPLDGT